MTSALEPTAWASVLKLAVTALFVTLNGFFVAAEFALVKVRGTRVEALAKAGHRQAQASLTILGDLNL
jgi:magnesium and cobalt exporter, CNNM family